MLKRFWERWRGHQEPPEWRTPITAEPVAWVRSPVRKPHMDGWEEVTAEIVVREDLAAALEGIEAYSHLVVLTWMHQVTDEARALLRLHPRGDPSNPLQGVFATRSQNRPNPLGLAVVPLLARQGNRLRVRGLDAIHGTPVLDIKPYVPYYDCVPDARLPEWTRARDRGYWLGQGRP